MLETTCTRGGSSVGVIPANPHKEMTRSTHRVYVAFSFIWINAPRIEDVTFCACGINLAEAVKHLGIKMLAVSFEHVSKCNIYKQRYATMNFLYFSLHFQRFAPHAFSTFQKVLHSLLRHARVLIFTHHLFTFPLSTDMRNTRPGGGILKSFVVIVMSFGFICSKLQPNRVFHHNWTAITWSKHMGTVFATSSVASQFRPPADWH